MVNNDIENKSTEELILEAAQKIFMLKGLDGARMQEIADQAGINKSLLHYYFRSKDKLFMAIFESSISKLMPGLLSVLMDDGGIKEKIRDFFLTYMDFLLDNPMMPGFIISEMNRNPDKIKVFVDSMGQMDVFNRFQGMVNNSVEKGEIRPLDPAQLLLNLVSLSVFPVLAGPLIKNIMKINDDDYNKLLNRRRQHAAEFVLNSIEM